MGYSDKEETYFFQPILMNEGSKKNHIDAATTVHHLPKKWFIFCFCGSAYPKFGIDEKEVLERGNTKIRILKKSMIMVQFNSWCLYMLVCYFDWLLEVCQGLYGGHLDFEVGWQNLCCTMYTVFNQKKSKKSKHVDLPSFIRKVGMITDFEIGGLQ